jgi:cytochrome b561
MEIVTGRTDGPSGAPLRGDETITGPEAQVFDPVMRSLHWLTLFLIVGVFSTAALIDHDAPYGQKAILIQLHRSLGLSIWVLTLIRLAWRQFAHLPGWPAGMPKAMQGAARYSELLLYALLMVQPVLGLLYTYAHGNNVNFFFLFRLPAIVEQDDELSEALIQLHGLAANILFAVIALHAAAALYHHFIRRDEVLSRMLPKAAQYRLGLVPRGSRVSLPRELWADHREAPHNRPLLD